MRKIAVIAKREYAANVRTKAFVISLVLMPIFMGGGIAAQKLLEGRVDLEDKRIVVVDRTGRLLAGLMEAATRRNEKEIVSEKTGRQVESRYIVEPGPDNDLTDDQRLDYSEQVRKRRIFAFVEIPKSLLIAPADAPDESTVRFYSESAVTGGLTRWFIRTLNQVVQVERLKDNGLDPAVVRRATAFVPVEELGLYKRDKSGEVLKADTGARRAAMFVPIGVMMLMFMSLMMSQTMLQNTLEEKQQRIAEVLLGSARPFELMMGKLLGGVGVSVTIVAIYLAGGFWMLNYYGYASLLRHEIVPWFLLFQVIGVLIFGSVFIAIGAACNELKEAQNYLMPVILLLVLPMMVWFKVLEEPMSAFAVALSLFPPCTPMLMILRMAITEAVPLWQPLVGIAGTLLMTMACVWVGGRVFRVGLLMQGKAPSLGQLARWIVKG